MKPAGVVRGILRTVFPMPRVYNLVAHGRNSVQRP